MAPSTLQQPLIMNQIMSIGLHLKPEFKLIPGILLKWNRPWKIIRSVSNQFYLGFNLVFQWMLTFSVKVGTRFVPLLSLPLKSQPRSYKNLNVFSGMCTAAKAKIRNLEYKGNVFYLRQSVRPLVRLSIPSLKLHLSDSLSGHSHVVLRSLSALWAYFVRKAEPIIYFFFNRMQARIQEMAK